MDGMNDFDCLVIGAGWYGLAAAKTYIELHPDHNVAVLEAASSAGGTWAQHRLYPGLKSNNMLGTYEYSDFPMDTDTYGIKPGEHIPGQVIHRYLSNYAQHFGVYERIRFNTKVVSAEPTEDGGWSLATAHATTGESRGQLHTKRLIVATGLTSEAFLPEFEGRESFGGPVFHSKDFLEHTNTLEMARNVSVLGGAKSAWDAAYAFASSGVPVDLIIRKSGRGPVWMAPPYVTPLKKWLEKLVHTRLLTWFSPCIWGDEDGYGSIRGFLHGSWLGRKLVDAFWGVLGSDVISLIGFDKHPEMAKLKPWNDAFWVGSGLSILNFPTDFFEFVRNGQIRVHIADVERLSEKTIHLSNGEELKADALLCATGWKSTPPIKFLPEGSDARLGMPHYSSSPDSLAQVADQGILELFPRLKNQPDVPRSERPDAATGEVPNQPFRLFKFMVPAATINERNIAFAGMISTITTAMCAQAQALWISAYMDGRLDRAPVDETEVRNTTIMHSQFGRWRYPCGYGARLPDFVFDAMPYVDMLLRDVGIENHRKGGWVRDVFEPYGPEDYRGLPAEWRGKHPL